MTYYLDTNICVFFFNGKFPSIREKMSSVPQCNIKLPAVVVAELYCGAIKSERREYNLSRYSQFIELYDVIPFENEAARVYGDIRTTLESKGQPIGGNDLMIAATALANNAVLVTNNVKEFSRIDGLIVEDWTKP